MSDHDDVIPISPQHREEEAAQHVLREVHSGRHLQDVLQDAYVTERLEADGHHRILDHPEVTAAIGEDIIADMRRMLAET
jgi:hypothetical protein